MAREYIHRFRTSRARPGQVCRAALLLACALAGCGRDTTVSTAGYPYIAAISHGTVIIDNEDALSLYEIDGSTYVFDITGKLPEIEPGRIIVGTEHGGFLRRVVSTSVKSGRLVVETEAGSLTEAVDFGYVDTVIRIGTGSGPAAQECGGQEHSIPLGSMDRGAATAGSGISLAGLTLLSGETGGVQADVRMTRGYIEWNPDLEFGLRIHRNRIETLRIIARGTVEFEGDIQAEVSDAAELSGEVRIASVSRPVIMHIGELPVSAVVTIRFSAGFVMTSASAANLETGCCNSFNVETGAEYHDGRWSTISSISSEPRMRPFSFMSGERISIRAFVRPEMEIVFFSADGLAIGCVPYYEFNGEMNRIPLLEWEMQHGIRAVVASTARIIDGGLRTFEAEAFSYSAVVDSGPFATDSYMFAASWGGEGAGDGRFLYPKGIAAGPDGGVYVVDNRNHRVQKFDSGGNFLLGWGMRGTAGGHFMFPEKVAVDGAGNVYVTDTRNHRIQKFLPDSTFVGAWGTEGNADGQFRDPKGITIDDEGNVYVVDTWHHRVQVFTGDGLFIDSWGGYGSGDGQFNNPIGIASGPGGYIFVADCHNHRVQKFTSAGIYVTQWGMNGAVDGRFNCPIDVAVDSEGFVYVVDYGNDRLQKFDPQGTFIDKLGGAGTGDGRFDHPEGIAVDGAGNLFILDSRNTRVQKFSPRPLP